jgi:hypothetical protein
MVRVGEAEDPFEYRLCFNFFFGRQQQKNCEYISTRKNVRLGMCGCRGVLQMCGGDWEEGVRACVYNIKHITQYMMET